MNSTETETTEPGRPPAARPASGVAIDPARLTGWREYRGLSRAELSKRIARLEWEDENGKPFSLTRDGLAKIENSVHLPRQRRPRAMTVRALCEVLGCTPADLGAATAVAESPPLPGNRDLVTALHLPPRVLNILTANGIATLDRLAATADEALLDLRGVSAKTLADIRLAEKNCQPAAEAEPALLAS